MRSLHSLLITSTTLVLAILLAGCASVQAPLPPSLELPKPPTDLRAVRKGDHVYLSWSVPTQTLDRQTVRRQGPTRVCRSLEALMSACGMPVSIVPPTIKAQLQNSAVGNPYPQAGFVDTLPADLQRENATRMVTYAVEALNLHDRSAGLSDQVRVPLAPTLPPPPSFRAALSENGVDLSWDCALPESRPGIRYVYRIYRRSLDSGVDIRLADVACPASQYNDQTAEWQKTYEYRITAVTSANLGKGTLPCPTSPSEEEVKAIPDCVPVATVEGEDSPAQKVFTKDIYPPGVPTGLQAVFSGPGQAPFIDLLWAPNTDADLAGYNVYRREASGKAAKMNNELIKTPAFRDTGVSAGKTYWYSVSAVDARGNESTPSEEASESVP